MDFDFDVDDGDLDDWRGDILRRESNGGVTGIPFGVRERKMHVGEESECDVVVVVEKQGVSGSWELQMPEGMSVVSLAPLREGARCPKMFSLAAGVAAS